MNPSDEIKQKLDIVDVLREYIQLKPAGVNFRALCPFHNEKSPSFIVSPEKQIWHCFGCQKGGDLISFVQEIEGLPFVEALRLLAPKAGVVLRKTDPKESSQRNRTLDCLELSARYYEAALLKSDEAGPAREYLARRGISESARERWRIGYSPESWDRLSIFLKSRGYSQQEIFLAGLSVRKEHGEGFYDRFRGRIMFPIRDMNGNITAFSARVSPEKEASEKMGKYINSPQSSVYDKSRIVFGLDLAKSEIRKAGVAVVVEGQMDAISAYEAGFANTVASSGTALTGQQLALIKRFAPNIALAFDADTAGELAAERGLREALSLEMGVKIISIPTGKDPDECIKEDPKLWAGAVENAKPMLFFLIEKAKEKYDIRTAEGKRSAADKLMPAISMFRNRIEQDFWLNELSSQVDIPYGILKEQLARINSVSRSTAINKPANRGIPPGKTKEDKLSEALFALLLSFPENLEFILKNVLIEYLSGDACKSLYRSFSLFYNKYWKDNLFKNSDLSPSAFFFKEFKTFLSDEELNDSNAFYQLLPYLDELGLTAERDYYIYTSEIAYKELLQIISLLKNSYLSRRLKDIERLMDETENSGMDPDEKSARLSELMHEHKLINEERSGYQAG